MFKKTSVVSCAAWPDSGCTCDEFKAIRRSTVNAHPSREGISDLGIVRMRHVSMVISQFHFILFTEQVLWARCFMYLVAHMWFSHQPIFYHDETEGQRGYIAQD